MSKRPVGIYRRYERIFLSLGLLVLFLVGHSVLNELADLRPKRYLPDFLGDHLPFVPAFVVVYLLGFVAVFVPAVVITDSRAFRLTALRFLVLMLICFMFFMIFPFAVRRMGEPPGEGLSVGALKWFQSRAKPYNSFPSLHVGFGILAAACCMPHSRQIGWAMVFFAVLVALSTVFLKLHNPLDAVAGALVALAVWLMTGDRTWVGRGDRSGYKVTSDP